MHRKRSTREQLDALDAALIAAVAVEAPVTVRGVFYRAVAGRAISKTEAGYRQVIRRLTELRRAGRVDYAHITDGTRRWDTVPSWGSPASVLQSVAGQYRRPRWEGQRAAVFVLSEKDTLTGVVSEVTDDLDVPLGVARGYASESFMWSTGRRLREAGEDGRTVHVLQLGDHDQSGIEAWADQQAKLTEFAAGTELRFARLAVTPEQVTELDLPTRPAKARDHERGFAGGAVEVDAIPPTVLRTMLRSAIEARVTDRDAWDATIEAEAADRARLRQLADDWQG